MKVSPKSSSWKTWDLQLSPINHIPVKTRPEVTALIAQDLPEDEDDDEYEPNHDDAPVRSRFLFLLSLLLRTSCDYAYLILINDINIHCTILMDDFSKMCSTIFIIHPSSYIFEPIGSLHPYSYPNLCLYENISNLV